MKKNIFRTRIWAEIVKFFFEEMGVSVRAIDDEGKVVSSPSSLPALCLELEKDNRSRALCREHGRRIFDRLSSVREMKSERCYAGLSMRIVPIPIPGEKPIFLQIGKVLTEIAGEEQITSLLEKHGLSKKYYKERIKGLSYMSGGELDRVSLFIGRLAHYMGTLNRQNINARYKLRLQKQLLEFVNLMWSVPDKVIPDSYQNYIEYISKSFAIPNASLGLWKPEIGYRKIAAAVGPESKSLIDMEEKKWDIFTAEENPIIIRDVGSLTKLGLNPESAPLTVFRIIDDSRTLGLLFLIGVDISDQICNALRICSEMLASYIYYHENILLSVPFDEEVTLLKDLSHKVFSAEDVDSILSMSLDAAMSRIQARRGSIFLVENEGEAVTDSKLKGAHEELSGMIKTLQPDSIAYKLYQRDRPMIVQDIREEFGQRKKRRFPYQSKSFISVPVRSNGKSLGILHLTELEGAGSFTISDLLFLEKLGVETGVAVHRLKLGEEVETLKFSSATDPLTKVYNQRFLEEYLNMEFQRANRFQHPISLLIVDIDDFKDYNDAIGHQHGDVILVELVRKIRERIRSIDIIARHGGDEFILLLPETNLKGAISIAEKIRAAIEATHFPFEGKVRKKKLTVSIGISTFPDMAISTEDLKRKADHALLEAKRIGKNIVLPWTS